MAKNKVVLSDGRVLIDLTADTVTEDDLAYGVTAHDKSGAIITGTSTLDSDTSEDTAAVAEILNGKTAHARGALLTGTMPNRGGATGTISTVDGDYTIPQGYHDGSGKVAISATEKIKLKDPSNIKAGIVLLGTTGTYSGESVTAQSKNATPGWSSQTVLPDSNYDYLSQVVVAAIPYTESQNSAGGTTVTIG